MGSRDSREFLRATAAKWTRAQNTRVEQTVLTPRSLRRRWGGEPNHTKGKLPLPLALQGKQDRRMGTQEEKDLSTRDGNLLEKAQPEFSKKDSCGEKIAMIIPPDATGGKIRRKAC